MCQSHTAIWIWLRSGLACALHIIVQHLPLVLCHTTLEMWLFQVEMCYQCEVTTGFWKLNIWRKREEETHLSNCIQMICLGYTVLSTSTLVKYNSIVSSAHWKVWLLRNKDLQLWRWRARSGDDGLAAEARRPESEPQNSHEKGGVLLCACSPSVEPEEGGSLEHTGQRQSRISQLQAKKRCRLQTKAPNKQTKPRWIIPE